MPNLAAASRGVFAAYYGARRGAGIRDAAASTAPPRRAPRDGRTHQVSLLLCLCGVFAEPEGFLLTLLILSLACSGAYGERRPPTEATRSG